MGNNNHMQGIFLFLIGIFLFTQTSLSDANADVKLIENWSKFTNFGQVSGVSVDTLGRIFVFHRADRSWEPDTFNPMSNVYLHEKDGPIKDETIIVFNPAGDVITQAGASMFFLPHGLTLDHENNIWVTDVALHQVVKFAPMKITANTTNIGKPLLALGVPFKPGNDEYQFCKPTDVAVDKDNGDFFVSDGYCNGRIVKYDKNGRYLLHWGRAPQTIGQQGPYTLLVPHALSLAQERKILYVADRENKRVVAYYSNNGTYVNEYATNLSTPIYSVAYCPYHGGLLHSLSNNPSLPPPYNQNNRVSVYAVDTGKLLFQYYPPRFFGNAHDIALSPNGNASYVVDLTHRIWKFKIEFHEALSKKEVDDNSPEEGGVNSVQIVPSRMKEEEFWGGTNIAIALVTLTIVIALLVFVFHIQKRKGAYRRSEMRGLILDDDEDEGINLS